jgi:hypothetical protein
MFNTTQTGFAGQIAFTPMTDPALSLFYQRVPRFAYAMDYLGPMSLLPKTEAIQRRYIQPQPKDAISVLAFDIDRHAGALAWQDAHLPSPNLAIINPENAHAHLLYLLEEPIFLGETNQWSQAVRFLHAVQRGLTIQLGADPAYSGLTCKNPLHPYWIVVAARNHPPPCAQSWGNPNIRVMRGNKPARREFQ